MGKKISPLRKNTLYFLSLFNAITFPIIVILFFGCILMDIPLKHLFAFIVIYAITQTISHLFDTDTKESKSEPFKHKYILMTLFGINILTLLFLALLIRRYELLDYSVFIGIITLVPINIIFLEFTYHFITRFMNTRAGAWTSRTLLLFVGAGIGIFAVNMMRSTPEPTIENTPKKSQSEVTGVISTVDPNQTVEPVVTNTSLPDANPSTEIASSPSGDTPVGNKNNTADNEVSGTLTTTSPEGTPGVTIDSIESLDGRATATLKDGKITVQVINPNTVNTNTGTPAVTETNGWKIHSSIGRAGGGGGLQGVVISAPVALPTPGTHANYQSIILTAEGSSGIFFTTDGSEPSCDGKGSTDLTTDKKSFVLKAISCFGGNRVRGPIASYTYTIGQ